MQFEVAVPAAWASQPRLDEAWRHVVHDWLAHLPDVVDGRLQPGPEASTWLLVAGDHLTPGAHYRVEDPELSVGTMDLQISGTAPDRSATLAYQDRPGHGERYARVELDGLDACGSLRSQADLGEVSWTVVADSGARLLDARVELAWARGELRLEVGHELRLHVEVVGVGIWRPAVAPLLAAGKGQAEKAARETLTAFADALAAVEADGRWVLGPEARIAACRVAWADVRRRLLAAEDATAAAGWGRRTGARFRAAYDALPPHERPTLEFTYNGPVAAREARIAEQVAARRFGRRRLVARLVSVAETADVGFLQAMATAQQGRSRARSGSVFRIRDQDLAQLSGLATPWSVLTARPSTPGPRT